jgi:glutamate synthase (NADPH) small chain
MKLKDILSPLYVWKRAFEKPYSIATLTEQRPGSATYRGFHQNDINKCIGCGSCAEICQNVTIDMVQAKDAKDGDSGLRPRFDYGLCCWCALCVDICPTGSLKMSNAYTWVEEGLDKDVRETFCFTPGVDEKPWDNEELGYKRPEGYEILHLDRIPMPHLKTEERISSFIEMVKGYSHELAIKEADRCIQCGICTATCPAHMNIPAYIKTIREDKLEEGLRIMYETNPLPGVCGRVCTRKCEDVCALSHRGEAISIRWLKRYLSDSFEAQKYAEILASEITLQNKTIAIVGAGAGGLSAAYYLLKLGYNVEIFEAKPAAGGMLRYGIPEYRLPYEALDKDINYIVSLGAKIHFNTKVGQDVSFDDLHEKFHAVFISVGLFDSNRLAIEGETLPGVINGLDFLDDITHGKKVELGQQVLVIGGGNVAMDAARTARRLGSDVTVLYRRREVDMPADREEIVEAFEEKVIFNFQAIPIGIEQTSDRRLNFIWGKAEMVQQEEGKRPVPVMIEGSRESIVADTVISAIGQSAHYHWMEGNAIANIKFGKFTIIADRWGKTSDDKVFIGGDIFNKTADAITAVADGHRSARAIDTLLQTR